MSWTEYHRWQEAALKLRRELFREHQRALGLPDGEPPMCHVEHCDACQVLRETRWCMGPLGPIL